MKIITITGSKSQNPQVSINLRINQLSDRLRAAQSPDESRELLAFFIEATEKGSVRNWLLEFQRTFNALVTETIGGEYAN
jgi:hypothetical protein